MMYTGGLWADTRSVHEIKNYENQLGGSGQVMVKVGNFKMNNKDLMYILPTPPQLILIIFDLMDNPSVGPQAACIHHV